MVLPSLKHALAIIVKFQLGFFLMKLALIILNMAEMQEFRYHFAKEITAKYITPPH